MNLRIQVDSVEKPIKCHSVGSGYASHRRSSALKIILYHSLCVLRNEQQSALAGQFCVRSNMVNVSQTTFFRRGRFRFRSSLATCHTLSTQQVFSRAQSPFGDACNTSMTRPHKSRAGVPSKRYPASACGLRALGVRHVRLHPRATTFHPFWVGGLAYPRTQPLPKSTFSAPKITGVYDWARQRELSCFCPNLGLTIHQSVAADGLVQGERATP